MRRGLVTAAAVSMVASAFVGCDRTDRQDTPVAVAVTPSPVERQVRDLEDEDRARRQAPEAQAAQGAADEPKWVPRLRRVCEDVAEPEKRKTRHTEGWEPWGSKVDVSVKDLRLWSPSFSKWTIAKVDDPEKTEKVRARGPFYGYGLTVEVENTSDQVLEGDNVYVWATYKSKTGERVCFADAKASRSWNPFGKKGKGQWAKEKEFSEWPLRPGEKKRYVVSRTSCFTSLFIETEPTEVKVDVYFRFRPLGSDVVIAGPLKSYTRDGGLLRGRPLAGSAEIQKVKEKKGAVPARVLYTAGDHVFVLGDKKSKWLPIDKLEGVTADSPLSTESLPGTTPAFTKKYGALTLEIDGWTQSGWRDHEGVIKQGHKMLSADVTISVDTSTVRAQLEASVASANEVAAAATADLAAKEAALSAAEVALAGAKGTEGEGAAKAAAKEAKKAVKSAKKAVKAAAKGQKAAEKAMSGGVAKFLKSEAKAVDCGKFVVDVGRKSLKAHKSSTLNKKTCKPLLAGESVSGKLHFDLERWDLPFVLTWPGPGKTLEAHRIASEALAKVMKN